MMILIAENVKATSDPLVSSLTRRDLQPLRKMTDALNAADVDYLDINTGHASDHRGKLMLRLVSAVQSATHKPLALHTADPRAMLAALRMCTDRPVINLCSTQAQTVRCGLEAAREYGVSFIGTLRNTEGIPRDANERGVRALDLIDTAASLGVKNHKLWFDPVACPVSKGTAQIKSVFEFLRLMRQIAPGCKSIVELSRVSQGSPAHLRPYLNRTCLMMLMRYGLSAAIVDAFDSELIEIARGRRPGLVSLVFRMMDGELPSAASVSAEEMRYLIMVRTLNGETLHGWSREDAWKYSKCAV